MIKLESKTNVDAPSAAWPYGDVRNKTLSVAGTKWDKEQMSDIIQFFAKLMDASGIAPNGLLDNQTNGFQLFEALQTFALTKQTIVEIGPWDMQALSSVGVNHGLGDKDLIRSVSAVIIDDSDLIRVMLADGPEGAIGFMDDTQIALNRVNGGFFDSANYNDGVINRGFVLIHHV